MLNFTRFRVGTGANLAGLLGLTVYIGIWFKQGMPLEPRYWYLGAALLGLTWLGALITIGFDPKAAEEDYAKEKLFADFTRKLLQPEELGTGALMMRVLDTLIASIMKEPVRYREFLLELHPETLGQIEDLCLKKKHRLWQELALEGQNLEVSGHALRLENLETKLQALEATLAIVGPITSIVTVNNQYTNKPTPGDSHAHQ